MNQSAQGSTTIVVKRTIAATVDELFDAWLDPDSLAQWMHPGTTARSTASVDARVGGAFEVLMHYPDQPLRHHGVYRQIERNRKLSFTWISDATHHTETLVTVEFNIAGAGTEIVLTHERLPGQEACAQHTQGWTLAFDLLADLATKPLVLTTFDWVPEMPRGFVRDIRVRWALEEAGLTYRVQGVPFSDRNAEHFSHQPFGQVPWLTCCTWASAARPCCRPPRAAAPRRWSGCSPPSIRSRWPACPGPCCSSRATMTAHRDGT
jgi:uncharacterized protein YndB with AHSA1/START domain